MKAVDVMVRNVVTVKADDDVASAVKLLIEHDISALPVVDAAGAVIGIISEADLMRREEIDSERQRPWWLEAITPASTMANEFAKSHGRKVREVMSDTVISATEEMSLGDIASLLEKHHIKRVPVLRDGKLVGIVSRTNLVQALGSVVFQSEQNGDADRVLRRELLDRLDGKPWTDFGSRNVIVRDGVVHLWGLVGSGDEHKALLALAEEVPGVRKVVDETIRGF